MERGGERRGEGGGQYKPEWPRTGDTTMVSNIWIIPRVRVRFVS